MNDVEQPMNSLSLSFEEAMYASYLRDPDSVSPDWRQYFDQLSHSDHVDSDHVDSKANGENGTGNGSGNGHKLRLGPQFRPGSFFAAPPRARGNGDQTASIADPPSRLPPRPRSCRPPPRRSSLVRCLRPPVPPTIWPFCKIGSTN